MLDSFIIEELKRREREERNRASKERPRLEIPDDDRPSPKAPRRRDDEDGDEPKRGVIIIDI